MQNRFLITRKTSPNDNVWMLWVDIQDKILIGSHLWVLKSIKEHWKEGRRETMTQRMRGGWVHFTHFKGGFVCVCNKLHKYNYGWSQVSSNVSTHLNIPHSQCTSSGGSRILWRGVRKSGALARPRKILQTTPTSDQNHALYVVERTTSLSSVNSYI